MKLKAFIASENGAVTVDWVLLTAGVVGLGLATTSVVSVGVEAASANISDALVAQNISTVFASTFVAATAALTETAVWDDPNATSREFTGAQQISFASEISFSPGDEGIIFESGGTGTGFILYQTNGMLYLQAGSGNGTGATNNRGEAAWQVTEGTHTIEGGINSNGGLALYVNGEIVDQSSFNSHNVSGGDVGTVGGGANSVSRNRGNFNANTPGHPGVTSVTFFEGQTTGEELVPLS